MSVESGDFSCMNSTVFGNRSRWIAHDPNGGFAGEFSSERDAKSACERWNKRGGGAVTVDWDAAEDDADDSDRGTYTIKITGTNYRRVVRCGWHSMEEAARVATSLRDMIADIGLEAAIRAASAFG